MKIPRHHPDHDARIAVEKDLTAGDSRVAAELRLPDPVAHDDRSGIVLTFLGFGEEASSHRPDAEYREQTRGDRAAFEALRIALPNEVEGSHIVCAHGLEGLARRFPFAVDRGRGLVLCPPSS